MARSSTEPLTPMENAAISHPSQSRADTFPNDRLIRANGWRIHARPKGGPVLWAFERRGLPALVMAEADVLARIEGATTHYISTSHP